MDANLWRVFDKVEELDRQSQALLAERLIERLIETSEHRKAWLGESLRRRDEFRKGNIEAIDTQGAFTELQKRVRS